MSARPRIWPVVLVSLAGILILCLLGQWQLQRLHWKEALLAELASKAAAAPVPLAEAGDRLKKGQNIDFLKVTARGHFLHDAERHMISSTSGGGWTVITPFVTDDHHFILVDRGIVPQEKQQAASRAAGNPEGEQEISGVLRLRTGGKGYFTPENDPAANMWFWWDVSALLNASPRPEGTEAFPAILQLVPGQASALADQPQPQPADAGLTNNHLQYAITWFSLALTLAVIAGLYIRGQMKKPIA